MSFFTGILKYGTLGIVNINPDTGACTIKDPITGTYDNVCQAIDSTRDENEGIWFGRGCLFNDSFGINCLALRQVNADVMHLIVRIDGIIYSYESGQGNLSDKIYVRDITQSYDRRKNYTWEYKGESIKSRSDVKNLVNKINTELMKEDQYKLLIHNCQKMATTLKKYAKGELSYSDAYYDAVDPSRQRINPF